MTVQKRKLTEPLETITTVVGAFLAAGVAVGLVSALLHKGGEFFAFGVHDLCATDSHISVGGSSVASDHFFTAKPGGWLNDVSNLTACTSHAGIAQRLLYTLTTLPSFVLYAGIILLLWLMIRDARRSGPFTPRVAARMRFLGWFVILGAMAAATLQALAADLLLDTILTRDVNWIGNVLDSLIASLFPAPIIAGGALLTFARVIRLGALMDDEIKATI